MPVDLFTLIQSPLSRCFFPTPPLTYATPIDCPTIRKDFFYQKTPKLRLGETEKALELQSKQFELGGSDSYTYIDKRALITGDVVKYAHDEIVAPMEAAFCSLALISGARRIEFVFGDQDGHPYALLTVLSPRSIKLHEWTGTADGGSPSSLGPRIRAQAQNMRCPQVLMFDGTKLLRVEFGDIDRMATTDHISAEVVCEGYTTSDGGYTSVQRSTNCTIREAVYATILKGSRRRTIERFSLQTSFNESLIHAFPEDGTLWDFGCREGVAPRTDQMALRRVTGEGYLVQGMNDHRPFRMAWVFLTQGNVNEIPLLGPF